MPPAGTVLEGLELHGGAGDGDPVRPEDLVPEGKVVSVLEDGGGTALHVLGVPPVAPFSLPPQEYIPPMHGEVEASWEVGLCLSN